MCQQGAAPAQWLSAPRPGVQFPLEPTGVIGDGKKGIGSKLLPCAYKVLSWFGTWVRWYARLTTLSIWPHLFRGAGHEKRRGEQLKWSLTFRLYIGSFPCAQLPVHTAPVGPSVFLCVFSLGLCFVCSLVLFLAIGGSFKLVMLAPRTVRQMTQLLRGVFLANHLASNDGDGPSERNPIRTKAFFDLIERKISF